MSGREHGVVIKHRYVLAFMVLMAIITCYNIRLALHIAITEIAAPIPPSEDVKDDVCPDLDNQTDFIITGGIYNWTEHQQGLILVSFFPGYLITHLPGGIIADKFGGRPILTLCIATSAIFSCLTPIAVHTLDWLGLMAVRFVIGLSQGPLFPASAALLSHWIPKNERATVGGFVYSGVQLGSMSGTFCSGMLIAVCRHWPVVFYVWGGTAILWCVVFLMFCHSKPSKHPHITAEEKQYIEEQIGLSRMLKAPWKSILTDMALWALVIGQVGHDFIAYIIVVDLPKFMKGTLKFDITKNSTISATTFFLMWISSIITGWLSDVFTNKNTLTVEQIRKIYGCVAALGPSICTVIATYVGCDRVAVVGFIWLGMFLMGPWFSGPKVNNLDLSVNFSGIIMSFTNGVGVLSGIFAPYIVALICTDAPEDVENFESLQPHVENQSLQPLMDSSMKRKCPFPVNDARDECGDNFTQYKRVKDVQWQSVMNDSTKSTICWEVAMDTITEQAEEIKKLRGTIKSLESKMRNIEGLVENLTKKDLIAKSAANSIKGTLHQWRIVFWIALFVSFATIAVFLIWGKGVRSKWDYLPDEVQPS